MTDVVKRLRHAAQDPASFHSSIHCALHREAASEIERFRRALAAQPANDARAPAPAWAPPPALQKHARAIMREVEAREDISYSNVIALAEGVLAAAPAHPELGASREMPAVAPSDAARDVLTEQRRRIEAEALRPDPKA